MPRKILIINSSADQARLLERAFDELEQRGFSFSLYASSPAARDRFRRANRPVKNVYLGPGGGAFFPFLLTGWLAWLNLSFRLMETKINQQAETVVCLDFNEKILATIPARLLKLKVVWLESPELDYRRLNRFLFWLYKLNSRLARVITFNSFAKSQFASLRGREAGVSLLPPGARLDNYQENIFDKLAGRNDYHRKYFTVGAVTPLNQKQKIETIFQAVKTGLSVIPNLQLIIIGEGEERKNLLWLAKKMGIENLVWLVGEQERLKKWLDSFDVFLAIGDRLKLDDYGNILEAMAAGLPVLAPRHTGAEDLVVENKTGALVETDNGEMLARQIIKLHQDKKLCQSLGRNGRERANQLFRLERMVADLEKILLN